jgi:hypothetical protein
MKGFGAVCADKRASMSFPFLIKDFCKPIAVHGQVFARKVGVAPLNRRAYRRRDVTEVCGGGRIRPKLHGPGRPPREQFVVHDVDPGPDCLGFFDRPGAPLKEPLALGPFLTEIWDIGGDYAPGCDFQSTGHRLSVSSALGREAKVWVPPKSGPSTQNRHGEHNGPTPSRDTQSGDGGENQFHEYPEDEDAAEYSPP